MNTDLILVTGATGNTGSVVLQLLESRGAHMRALVRRPRPDRAGASTTETVTGDFDDSASLSRALEGVTRAYLVTPSSPDAEAQQVRFAELAASAGVRHIVKLSQFAADEASPVRFLRYHAAVELRALLSRRGRQRIEDGTRGHRPRQSGFLDVRARLCLSVPLAVPVRALRGVSSDRLDWRHRDAVREERSF